MIIETVEKIPAEYFMHMEGADGLYEIRVQFGSDIFRVFCFFDERKLVVLSNGFQKKTPRKEIEKALRIKEEYESERITNTNKK